MWFVIFPIKLLILLSKINFDAFWAYRQFPVAREDKNCRKPLSSGYNCWFCSGSDYISDNVSSGYGTHSLGNGCSHWEQCECHFKAGTATIPWCVGLRAAIPYGGWNDQGLQGLWCVHMRRWVSGREDTRHNNKEWATDLFVCLCSTLIYHTHLSTQLLFSVDYSLVAMIIWSTSWICMKPLFSSATSSPRRWLP